MATAEVAPAYAPEDPTLPKPWTGLIDGNTGVLYYWNPETNATQYEKPAPLPPPIAAVPPSDSTPKLAPIPTARTQKPNDNTLAQHDLDRQMPQLQPMHQMPNHQAHHVPNQLNQQYPHMQVNQMAQPQFPKTNELSVPHYQGHQQHGLPIGNHQLQQNGFQMERDLRRQVGEPVGFSAPPIQQTNGPSGDHHFTGPAPHISRTADYSVRPEQHFGRPASTGTGGAFSELPQMGPDAIHRQQPNQMGNSMIRPPMVQKAGYGEEQHGRGRNEFYSSGSKEGSMMFQSQQLHGNIPHAGNHQVTFSFSISLDLQFFFSVHQVKSECSCITNLLRTCHSKGSQSVMTYDL